MKQMTSISIILMIPTVIASFMNVPNSLQNNSMGLLIIISISILFSVFEFSYSKEEMFWK
jgi:magnesium transporter